MRTREFIKSEKEHYGKIFVDISYGIDKITPFLSHRELDNRKYVSRLPVLKKYIDAIEAVEREDNKGGFFGRFGSDKNLELLEGYKQGHREELEQLEKCSSCECLNCMAECRFGGCGGCREGAEVVSCDHQKMSVVFHGSFIIDLTNERNREEEKYSVLATLEDCQLDRKYIIIEGIHNKEKFILYYYPGISEDNYGEITDEKEFEYIVSVFESVER